MSITTTRLKWFLLGSIVGLVTLGVVIGIVWALRGERSEQDGDRSPKRQTTTTAGSAPSSGADIDPGSGRPPGANPELRDESLQMGLIQREYLVLSPSSVAQGKKLPLVVALHGLMVDRSGMLDAAQWREAVEERNFVAVFPQGFGNSWNVGPCCPPANLLQMDDVGFLDAVIDAVVAAEPIDRDRVFMTGFSGGGLMTYRYGCERADRLAAIAPMAGVNLTGCAPGEPLSLLHQHSDPDLVVPFDGSLGVGQLVSAEPLPPVVDTVKRWAEAIGCGPQPPWRTVADGVQSLAWNGCAESKRVELVRIDGLGHEWPKTKSYDGLAEMLDFFGIN